MELPKPEWVKLIPADSIPVFCFNENLLDRDMAIICEQLKEFFGDREFLAMRGGDVQIYAIAAKASTPPMPQCICGGEPHVSHCPANRDPFLRELL